MISTWREWQPKWWGSGPLGTVRRQLAVGIAVIVGTTTLLFVWEQTRQLNAEWNAQQVHQATVLGESVAAASALWLASRDDNGLQEIVAALKPFPDLAHVMVLDRQRRVLAHSDAKYRGKFLHDFDPVEQTQVLTDDEQFVDVVSPVRLNNRLIGWVRVGLTGRDLARKIDDVTKRGLTSAIVGLLLSLLVATAAGTLLTRRLARIQAVAERVQRGDLHGRVHLTGSDEAARLAAHFDQMLDNLMQGRNALTLAANVFTHAREAIIITDAQMAIVDVNEAFTRIMGMTKEDVVGQSPLVLTVQRQSAPAYEHMLRQLADAGHWQGELLCRRKDGELINILFTISAVRDEDANVTHHVALFTDITVAKHHELQLEHMAHYDPLTGLPNRVLLAERLAGSLRQCQAGGESVSVVFLDLDGFKEVNDTHGHAVGDRLLVNLANRMKRILREGDTLARIGGDEFVALVQGFPNMDASIPVIERLLAVVSEPVVLDDVVARVTASLGVTTYPQDTEVDAERLLRQADQAMYVAKTSGKNCYVVFQEEPKGHEPRMGGARPAGQTPPSALVD